MTDRVIGGCLLALGGCVFSGMVWVNVEVISDAYGAGPPYYSQTTNMDKWSDPLPYLLVGDVLACIIVAVALRYGMRRLRAARG